MRLGDKPRGKHKPWRKRGLTRFMKGYHNEVYEWVSERGLCMGFITRFMNGFMNGFNSEVYEWVDEWVDEWVSGGDRLRDTRFMNDVRRQASVET